ncbi:3-isopropylmalate dehydrogenase [Candidatus Roizmanbacteria bacterium]|nr:MAG: 3-isopropylmalate dehydrogenase [Candidatus Roizmanbacteria bacterium]
MKTHIALLPGDGVGPEVVQAAVTVLDTVGLKFGHEFNYKNAVIGGAAIDAAGDPFPKETEQVCLQSDAILFGAIGDPKYDNDPSAAVRPEQGLLNMRKTLGLYANVRPIQTFSATVNTSPLKKSIVDGTDFVVIRELIGGIYFGERGRRKNGTEAFDTSSYSISEITRVSKFAFELAEKRHRHLTLVDKANVLETSRLWRETVRHMSKEYPDVIVEYMFVDNASMQIIKNPSLFDVILTENMFGDILTDEASVITGSIGMLPSASIGEKTSLYEPIHGSYPKAAGKNSANPIGTILSAAMMLEHSFNLTEEAQAIRQAIEKTLEEGYGTKDIVLDSPLGTQEMAEKIALHI